MRGAKRSILVFRSIKKEPGVPSGATLRAWNGRPADPMRTSKIAAMKVAAEVMEVEVSGVEALAAST